MSHSSNTTIPPVICLLDDDDDEDDDDVKISNSINLTTPMSNPRKRQRQQQLNSNLFIIEDSPTTSCAAKTPRSTLPTSIPIISSDDNVSSSDGSDDEVGLGGWTFLKNIEASAGADLEKSLERAAKEQQKNKKPAFDVDFDSWLNIESTDFLHEGVQSNVHVGGGDLGRSNLKSTNTYDRPHTEDDSNHIQPVDDHEHETANVRLEISDATNSGDKANAEKKEKKVKQTNEKKKLMEEKLRRKELEKERKSSLKAEAAERKKLEKEMKKFEQYKFTEKDIVAVIDSDVLSGSLGGPLLTLFNQKHRSFEIKPKTIGNPIAKSIVWRMNPPDENYQCSPGKLDIQYILLIYDDAEEFCNQANDGSLIKKISLVQKHYPAYTICCLTNRLMSFINKREQQKYKNQKAAMGWKRPPVEELFAKLATQFANVHSRQCADEAEVAEHVVGLTTSLGKCYSRPKLTHLSVNANGCNIPKNCVDRELIMKNPWLKALVSIPKVQPRCAIAIWKKYPTMKTLLRVYMDPNKTVYEKESILEDLPLQDLLNNNDRKLGIKCSKRVFRVLMAENGSIKTDDVEDGADFSQSQ